LIRDFYSYIQEEDDQDLISYYFLTDRGDYYYVYFDPYQYDGYIDSYPNLLGLGFGFGFHRVSKQEGWTADPKIGDTISNIVLHFIRERTNEVVLLYHCEYGDKKQRGRDKIFQDWYNNSAIKDTIIKKRLQVSQIERDGKETNIYMGYLTPDKNNKKNEVEQEFTLFAEKLVANKP